MARRRKSQERGARTINRLFWLGVLGFVAWFSVERVAVPVMSASGYRRVEGYAPLIRSAADEFRLDPNLLAGVALAESSGRPDAVSSAGALGMFQLMLPTARERARLLGLREPERSELLADPALNGRLAASYLRWLVQRYGGDVEKVLIAYNAGPGRLDGWIREHGSYDAWRAGRPGDSPVLAYARKVQRYRDEFAARGVIAPSFDQPAAPPVMSTSLPVYGPPLPPENDDRTHPPVAPLAAPASGSRP